MKRFNINITMRRKTRGLQLLLRIHFNNNNKLIVQERFQERTPHSPAESATFLRSPAKCLQA